MYKARKLFMTLAFISISPLSSAATNIDILIVFSNDTGLSLPAKTALAGRYVLALGSVYGSAGVTGQLDGGDQTVTVWPLPEPEMSYAAKFKSDLQAVQWMKDQNAILASPLRVAREALGNPGADIILMVVPETTDATCGRAGPGNIPKVVATSRSESSAFAIVHLASIDPDCVEALTVPHEVGHLLYSEHDFDTNGEDLLPAFNNHATQASNSSLKSLMWDSTNASKTNLLSGFLPVMETAWADNVEFMSTESFSVVATYRQPAPPSCNLIYSFQNCNGNNPVGLITATLPGYTVTLADFDIKFGTSPWMDVFEGIQTCPAISPQYSTRARAILQTIHGISQCEIPVPRQDCSGNGGGSGSGSGF